MISGLPPGAVRAAAPRSEARALPVSGNALPSPGREPPAAAPAAVAPPDRSRSIEVLDRYLAESQRSLQFLHDPEAGHTVILIVHPGTGEVLRQIPARERLALAQWIAPPGPPVIDLRA
jgi:hypothetical protein